MAIDNSIRNAVAMLLAILLLLSTGPVWAQTTPPPTVDIEESGKRKAVVLCPANLEIAQDYRDILEQVERLTYDYQAYFAELNNLHAERYRNALYKILVNLNQSNYCSDLDLLLDDIVAVADQLKEREKRLKKSAENRKLYSLAKSLRRELELISEILEEDLYERVKMQAEARAKVQAYLIQEKAKAKGDARVVRVELIRRHSDDVEVEELNEELRERIEEYKEQLKRYAKQQEWSEEIEELARELTEDLIVEIDDEAYVMIPQPDVPSTFWTQEGPPGPPSAIPAVPAVPYVEIAGKDRLTVHLSGEAEMAKEFLDSIRITSKSTPIYVSNQIGSLRITGWNKDKLAVRFNVRILAECADLAKDFVDEIEVKLYPGDDGIYLSSRFPDITDPKRKILGSSMYVRVPRDNKLVCDNSFGEIDISELGNGVRVNSNHCGLKLYDIAGGIEAANNMASTVVDNSTGLINLKSSLGPIVVTDCRADLEIENAYASVEISNCAGHAVIRNSGTITVTDQVGSVEIENSNGVVDIKALRGNLAVQNSFKPLYVSGVEGSATIENMNASIDVRSISGTLTALNRFGSISGKYLDGPIHITNQNGSISVVLDQFLNGPSSIVADFGVVSLKLSEASDILLTASSVGGSIEGDFTAYTDKLDPTSPVLEIPFGKGRVPLEVTGNNTKIIISKAD